MADVLATRHVWGYMINKKFRQACDRAKERGCIMGNDEDKARELYGKSMPN